MLSGYISISENDVSSLYEIISYGKTGDNLYFFYRIECQLKNANLALQEEIGDYLSCTMYQKDRFICAFNSESYFRICLIFCQIGQSECNELFCESDNLSTKYNAFLYDTVELNVKVLGYQINNNNHLQWTDITINPDINEFNLNTNFFDLPEDYNNYFCNTKNCDFIQFNSEYLLCCSCTNYIFCSRLSLNFITINNFNLDPAGTNSYIKIMNNRNYISIFFYKENDQSLYKKNIYIPICNNINKDLYQEAEINVQEFFARKSDTKYYLSFDEFNTEKIAIRLKDGSSEIIKGKRDYLDDNKELIFLFSLIDNNILDNDLTVSYNISIEETYFAICTINFSIKKDYNILTTENTNDENNIIDTNIIQISTLNNIEETKINSQEKEKMTNSETYLNAEKIISTQNNYEQSETLETPNYYKVETSNNYKEYSTRIICYTYCKICDGVIELNSDNDIINQNCVDCIDGYHFKYGTKNCYDDSILDQGYYLSSKDSTYHECSKQCKTCKENSTNNNPNCLSCFSNTFLFNLNNSCIESCPSDYEKDKEGNKCIKNLEKSSLTEFKNQIMNNITSFVNSSNMINGTDFIAVVFSIDDINPKEQLKNGISAIDLGNCSNTIKEYYKIDDFIVVNMESKTNKAEGNDNDNALNIGKNTQIELYDYSGRKLNLSICNEEIKIMKYIGDVEELNIQSAMNLADQGIDVFNASDKFFNDICHYYDNKDGKDIILDDRRNDIYQNVSFCQDGCEYTGMDYELMAANCSCDSNILQNDESSVINEEEKENSGKFNFDTLKKSFISNLFDFNYQVLSCYNLTIKLQILKKNIGFYCMTFMLLLQIIFLFVYIIKGLKGIKKYMIIFGNKKKKSNLAFSPPKNKKKRDNKDKIFDGQNKKNKYKTKVIFTENEEDNIYNHERKDDNKQNKIRFMDYYIEGKSNFRYANKYNNEDNNQNIINNNIIQTLNIQKQILKINNNKNKKLKKNNKIKKINYDEEIKDINSKRKLNSNILKIKNDNDNKEELYKTKKYKLKNKSSHKDKKYKKHQIIETKDEKNEKKNKFKHKIYINSLLPKKDEELQDMEYKEAIIYDKRSYLRMYWSFLVDSQIILGTFCTENYLNLFVVKLSFFICTFEISFFLNALFYTDEYISDAYHNDGVLDFISSLPKSIYSFIATLITTNLLRMLSSSKNELQKVIKEKGNNKDYKRIINNKLKKLRTKLIIYFILVFILGIFFSYYVTAFCSVYRNSQKYWFYGCLESLAMDSSLPIISCLILSLLRYISIKKKIECLYKTTNFLSIFL